MKTIKLLFLLFLVATQVDAQSMLERFKLDHSQKFQQGNRKLNRSVLPFGSIPFFEIPERPDSADYYFALQGQTLILGRYKLTYAGNSNRIQQLDIALPGTQIVGARINFNYNAQQKLTSFIISENNGLGGPLVQRERQTFLYDAQNNLVSLKNDTLSGGNWTTIYGDSLNIIYTGTTPTTVTYFYFNDFTSMWDASSRFTNITYNGAGEITGFIEQYPSFVPGTFDTYGRFSDIEWDLGWPGLFAFIAGFEPYEDNFASLLVPRKPYFESVPSDFIYEILLGPNTYINSDRRVATLSSGVVTEILEQTWDGTTWENDLKIAYQYNNGNITQITESTWDGVVYENDYQYTYFYDQPNNYRGSKAFLFLNGTPNLDFGDSVIINYAGTSIKSFSYTMDFGGVSTPLDSVVYNPGSIVNVANNTLANSIKSFPNPAKNQINLFIGGDVEPGNFNISIFDLSGKLVYQENQFLNANSNNQVDFGNLKSGLYFLKVSGEQGFYHQKLIIQE